MSCQDPLLATYSYISPNLDGELLGPFCVDCMNSSYSSDSFHFHSDVSEECGLPIFLHTKTKGKQYKINDLVYLNGSQKPFLFRKLPEDVELLLLNCSNGCHEENENTALQEAEQPPPEVVVPLDAAIPSPDVQSHSEKEPVGISSGWVLENGYPFLKGRQMDECEDVITREKLKRVLFPLRSWISKMKPTIAKRKDIMALPNTICTLCGTKEMNACNALEHSTTKRHISKVYSSGLVFSRSQDLEMALRKAREAALLVECSVPTAAIKFLSVSSVFVTQTPSKISTQHSPPPSKAPITNMTDFPFFKFRKIDEGKDDYSDYVFYLNELWEELECWRYMDNKMLDTICELVESLSSPPVPCDICGTKPKTGKAFIRHATSLEHVKKAYDAGLVCTRSEDVDVFYQIVREAQRLVKESKPTVKATSPEPKHVMLRDNLGSVRFPLLSPRPPPRQVFQLLADWQVRLVWENARRFIYEEDCRYSNVPNFIENCPRFCSFCDVRSDCVCGMLTHVFSEEHRLKMGHPVRYVDVEQWTNVLQAMWRMASEIGDEWWRSEDDIWDDVFPGYHQPIYQRPVPVFEPIRPVVREDASLCVIS